MKLLDLFIKKRDELPYEYSFEGERIDYTHLFFSAPNPETQRNGVLSINGMAHATMSHSELIPNDFTDIYYLPFPLDSILSTYKRVNEKNVYYHIKHEFMVDEGFLNDITNIYFMKLCGEYTIYLNGTKILDGMDKVYVNANVSKLINVGLNTLILTFKEDKHKNVIGPSGPIYLETTPRTYIKSVEIKTDIKNEKVSFNIDTVSPHGVVTITTPTAMNNDYIFDTNQLDIKLDNLILWTPSQPFFYQYTIKLNNGGDSVRGIFALLEYKLDTVDGVSVLTINGEPTPIKGVLDNYYYSDSLTLPPTITHLKNLFSEVKSLGFNSIRKTKFVDIKDYYYNGLLKGLLIAQDIEFKSIDDLDNKIEYLKNFQAVYLVNIILTDKNVDYKELYSYIKSKMPDKLISINIMNKKSFGDINVKREGFLGYDEITSKIEEPFITNLKFENRIDGLEDFMNNRYIPSSVMGMVGFYYSSINSVQDGIYNPSLKKIRAKKARINEILK